MELFQRLVAHAPLDSPAHRLDHSLRMLTNLRVLARGRDLNLKILQMAVVLHDIGLFYSNDHCHGPHSAEKIRESAKKLGLPAGELDSLCSMVRAHDDKTFVDNSEEAMVLRLLDVLDAFGLIGVYRYLEIYTRRGIMPPEIFERASANMESRFQSIDREWLSSDQFSVIEEAYTRGRTVLLSMASEAGGQQPSDLLTVFTKMKLNGWDWKRAIPTTPLALEFMLNLRAEFAKYGIK